jgi:hypothetical protein
MQCLAGRFRARNPLLAERVFRNFTAGPARGLFDGAGQTIGSVAKKSMSFKYLHTLSTKVVDKVLKSM